MCNERYYWLWSWLSAEQRYTYSTQESSQRGKADLVISKVEYGVNVLQEAVTNNPESCWM